MRQFINQIVAVYLVLFCACAPFIVAMIPAIICAVTENMNWMYLMFLSFPIGVVVGIRLWQPSAINRCGEYKLIKPKPKKQ